VAAASNDRITPAELAAEGVTALPDKEVMSLLDLNADLALTLDTAAPIDLAVGANANVAAPIDAAVNANVLSPDALSSATASQASELHQGIVGDATATSQQGSTVTQSDPLAADGGGTTDTGGGTSTTAGDLTDGNLLNINVNLDGDLHLASPIDGSVAANANVAAPIDAAVSANIGSPGAQSVAVAEQSALIDQHIEGNATATGIQDADVTQGTTDATAPSAPTDPTP
jgi:hypothetical protein